MIPVSITHPKNENMKYTVMYAAWKVARTDVKARKKGRVEKKEEKSDAARLLDLINGVTGMKVE